MVPRRIFVIHKVLNDGKHAVLQRVWFYNDASLWANKEVSANGNNYHAEEPKLSIYHMEEYQKITEFLERKSWL